MKLNQLEDEVTLTSESPDDIYKLGLLAGRIGLDKTTSTTVSGGARTLTIPSSDLLTFIFNQLQK